MSSVTDKVTDTVADDAAVQHSAGLPVRRMDMLTLVLWGAVAVSFVLVITAGVTRWRSTQDVTVHWGTVQASEDSMPSPSAARDSTDSGMSGNLLAVDADSLASLGATLDDPRFGQLGSARRADPDEFVPITRRWQFSFAPGLTEGRYAEQMAALGVEFGVLAADGSLQYLTGIGIGKVKRRAGVRKDEQRPYWTWDRGDLRRADKILLRNAGLPIADEIILHFVSPEMIKKLAQLEKDFQKREPQDILRTRFALKRTFRGYEVFVAQQIER